MKVLLSPLILLTRVVLAQTAAGNEREQECRSVLTARRLAILLTTLVISHTCEAKHNVLIILTEDQGSQMSFVGTPGLYTPNMDRIANEGVYFNQAFVNYPVCSPSKASIYTGTYCHTNGQMGPDSSSRTGSASRLRTPSPKSRSHKAVRTDYGCGPAIGSHRGRGRIRRTRNGRTERRVSSM